MNLEIWNIDGKEYTSIIQLSRFVKVSPPSVYRWVYLGMPACVSNMRTYLIPLREALKWIEEYRGKTW